MNKDIILVLSLLAIVFSGACATDQASQLRTERPTQIGWLGAIYRYQPNQAAGVSGSFSGSTGAPTSFTQEEDEGEKDEEIVYQNMYEGFYHYYPWETSAFFIGAGLRHAETKFRFDEPLENDADTTTSIKFTNKSDYLAVPVGWAWIWGTGFSLTLDLGPRFRIGRSQSFSSDGAGLVSKSSRDETVDDLEKLYAGSFLIGGNAIIGYSF